MPRASSPDAYGRSPLRQIDKRCTASVHLIVVSALLVCLCHLFHCAFVVDCCVASRRCSVGQLVDCCVLSSEVVLVTQASWFEQSKPPCSKQWVVHAVARKNSRRVSSLQQAVDNGFWKRRRGLCTRIYHRQWMPRNFAVCHLSQWRSLFTRVLDRVEELREMESRPDVLCSIRF